MLPCFLDDFQPLPTICGPSGTHKRWDFKVNFVAVILWTNSHKLSSKLRLRHNWWLSESKITSWINNWEYKLRHISNTFNNFFRFINPHSIHISPSLQLQCLIHPHRWHPNQVHRHQVHPSMQRRWYNRWRTPWSPVCRHLWTRPKSAIWTNNILLRLHHQFKPLHPFQVILLHRLKFHHHHNTLNVALGLAPIVTMGHQTNVQSLFHAALVGPHHWDEHIGHRDQDQHIAVDNPFQGTHQDVPVELPLSTCDQPLHVDEKYGKTTMMTSILKYPVENQLPFILHHGNINTTLRIHRPTLSTTRMSTHHMNNRPPTSGNPGTNGRTLLSPNLVPMPQGGLTTPSTLTNSNVTMIPPQSRPIVPLLHSPPTVHAKIHTDPARSNHVSPPVPSLLDMSPSISKMVPKKNGLVIWCMLWIIQIGCELPMNSSQKNVLRSPPLCHKTIMMPPRKSSTRSMPESQVT